MLGAEESGPRLTVDHRGVRESTSAEADGTGRDAPSAAEAVRIAQDAVETFGLADRVDLVADKVRHSYHAGGTLEEAADPRVRETHVVCAQLVDGHPVVTPAWARCGSPSTAPAPAPARRSSTSPARSTG
ncbi:hypothetical protein MUY14_18015 [Amycolatopsis sp. FBCC-B4732]|uniref:hypothetical protein n=1 Tax=Amycolatopsis sp. FBCC-B4732 TaxID=3079339 RepID=UPI001FF14434|nr:hypothetical protein [Amycolatopsis sp. FBCC-B4732]UOX92420.1 hypothetical protein MUY14_18015 [Amycolatopsis sp. FBCC-B4732]